MCFFAGVLLNELLKHNFNKRLISELGILLTVILFMPAHKQGMEKVFGNLRYSFSFIIFPVLIMAVMELKILQKILSIPPILYLGKLSMSFYLLHIPVFRIIKWLSAYRGGIIKPSMPITYAVILLITLIVSACEYEICEKRLFPRCIPKIVAFLKKEN